MHSVTNVYVILIKQTQITCIFYSLGAPHDAGDDQSPCDVNADFVMAPFVPSLSSTSTTINPWRFSSCSIESFKNYVNSLG